MKLFARILSIGALALAMFSATGCHTTHRYGDARIRHNWNVPFVMLDDFYLKSVGLDQVGTNVLHVRNLPRPIYPHAPHRGHHAGRGGDEKRLSVE